MKKKEISADVREYLREIGGRGGKIGGKRSLETMTDEERRNRAKKAGAASAKVRAKKPARSDADRKKE